MSDEIGRLHEKVDGIKEMAIRSDAKTEEHGRNLTRIERMVESNTDGHTVLLTAQAEINGRHAQLMDKFESTLDTSTKTAVDLVSYKKHMEPVKQSFDAEQKKRGGFKTAATTVFVGVAIIAIVGVFGWFMAHIQIKQDKPKSETKKHERGVRDEK